MKRYFQLSLSLLALCSLSIVWCSSLFPDKSSLGQTAKKLPIIEKKTHKNYTQKIPGSDVSFDMVAIPGGIYMMGSPPDEKGRDKDEGPQHPVTVRPFWIGKCEVRWDEYDQYWIKRPGAEKKPKTSADVKADAVTRPTKPYADETFGHGRRDHPVLCITHHAAMEYCRWLSAKTGKIYRLPTEAEWEWAARAGTTTPYFFGSDPKKLGEYGWYFDNGDETTHKVGSKKPSPWGLYDIYGNVSEWCLDHYEPDYYKKFSLTKPTVRPVLPPTDRRYSHVVRGGSWLDSPKDCRSAARQGSSADWLKRDPQNPKSIWWMTDADYVGFRVVCPVEEQANLKGLKSKVTKESP